MSDLTPIRSKLVVDKTTGAGGNDLHHCFFLATTDVEGVYNLYTAGSKILAAFIVSGQDFNFTLEKTPNDKIHFHITDFTIDPFVASGDWVSDAAEPSGADGGTFQAQSDTGAEGDDCASAAMA